MNTALEFIAESLLGFLWWVLLYPVLWLLCTPVILLLALIRQPPYFDQVAGLCGQLTRWWMEWGLLVLP